ncbi:hypothetical protein ACXET9_06530 [Brachybacterium sp. DNPG3]
MTTPPPTDAAPPLFSMPTPESIRRDLILIAVGGALDLLIIALCLVLGAVALWAAPVLVVIIILPLLLAVVVAALLVYLAMTTVRSRFEVTALGITLTAPYSLTPVHVRWEQVVEVAPSDGGLVPGAVVVSVDDGRRLLAARTGRAAERNAPPVPSFLAEAAEGSPSAYRAAAGALIRFRRGELGPRA